MKGGKVREAQPTDAEAVGRLLHDFNTEFDDFTPGPEAMAERTRELLADGHIRVVLGGDPPCGIAVMRFRPGLWTKNLDCYLEELYVAPDQRGQGLGRAIMETVLDLARAEGAGDIHLGTDDEDHAAHNLYRSLGFRREGFWMEREL
jgi:GNAT superfamily N-acetyltransferase